MTSGVAETVLRGPGSEVRIGDAHPFAIIGERLWTLAVLEAWLRIFVDGRGEKPTAGAFAP